MINFRKAVLIIHGFAGGTYDEEALFFHLQPDLKFDVYNFTLPGHSTNLSNNISYNDWMKSVDEKIDELRKIGYKNIYLIGHSMGGVLAVHAAIKNPEVKKVVLVAPAFRYLAMEGDLRDKIIKSGPDILKTYDAKEVISRMLKVSVNQTKEFMKFIDYSKNIPELLTVPTLIIQGQEDQVVPKESSKKLYEDLGCPRWLINVSGVNHDVFRGPKVDLINKEISLFLKSNKYKAESIRNW